MGDRCTHADAGRDNFLSFDNGIIERKRISDFACFVEYFDEIVDRFIPGVYIQKSNEARI